MNKHSFIGRFVVILMCVVIVFSAGACKKRVGNTVDPNLNEYVYEGTHIYDYSPTGEYIIENKATDYTIVYPENAGNFIKTAVNDLVSYLAMSTEVKIPVKSDAEVTYSPDGKYLSLGNNALSTSAGMFVDAATLGEAGFRIQTVGKSVYMIGGGDSGTMYAAYEFLLRTIDFRAYYNDAYHYEKKDKVELYDFNITDIPDYAYRMRNYGVYDADVAFAGRMRMNRESDIWIPVGKNYWHNVFDYLPKETYQVLHPDWYSRDGMQLCFNAHGNQKEYEMMYDAILKKAKECVDAYPELENITFTQRDGSYWCQCEACSAEMKKYGTGAPGIIKICNRLAKDLNDYLAKQGRKVNVCMFAYGSSTNAPVIKNADGSFSPIDENCVCGKNVYVFYAPQQADYRYSAYDPQSGSWSENAKAWASLTEQMYMWIYSTNFNDYMMPYNTFDAMQGNYQFLKSIGANYIFDQSQFNQNNAPGWSTLKMWLNSKLAWNVNLDFNELLDEFFANFYMEAEKPMREMFEMFRLHMRYIQSRYSPELGTNTDLLKTDYWPKATIDQLLAKADEAYAAIAGLKKTEPDRYEILYDRICLETISFRYIDISLYNGLNNSQEQIANMKAFKADAERLGLTLFNELNSITSLWSKWKV